MKKETVDSIMYEVNKLIKDQEYVGAKIEYVLVNKQNTKHSIALIIDKNNELYEVTLKDNEIKPALDWLYNVDEDVFEHLENEYEIGFMSLEFHSGIWEQIEDIGIEEFDHKLGLQKYLKYCKDNNIDLKTLCEKLDIKISDIMQYYNDKTDYLKIENGQVQLPQEMYQKNNEISYIAFCLGYDLLNDKLSRSETSECDRVYDFCNYLAKKFIETDYYNDRWKSTYDNLREWLEDNKEIIQSEYLCYFGIDDKCILEIGQRNDTPVALVEHNFKDKTKEYIVAFHYKVDDKKTEWGYGYYYNKDLQKAKEDFEKVKAGGNLADTFKKGKNENIELSKNMEQYYKTKEEIETILKNDEEHCDYKIECILIDKKDIKKSYGIAMNYNDVAIIDISEKGINDISNAEYTFNIGGDSIFPSLENGIEIAYISMEAHYGLWQEIDRYYLEDIKNKKGVQMYLKYCKENNITKEAIDNGINYNETPDVMKYFQEVKSKNKNREAR